ncbi:Hypothetical predicted protein [Mytilus galloprovincialis]|uniref:Uncharacterized protein n=1 Tax=Mytilus galloprovincialis TaxID=29158 RepID=A0A8B6EKS6_MYTGA|nr:Hypothetical predicted protein [Mytilus galloprovincialis]
MDNGHNVKFLQTTSSSSEKDEDIEIVSEQYLPVETEKPVRRKPRKSILDDIRIFQDAAARKKLTRWIMVLGGVFIFLSGILLIVTLNMSKDIDDKVRDSNELLRPQADIKAKVDEPYVIAEQNITKGRL